MFVRVRTARYCRAAHLAALRDCAPSLVFLAVTAGVLLPLALFVIDITPHLDSRLPHSVSLTVAALIASAAQGAAIAARYRGYLRTRRKGRGCGGSRGWTGPVIVDLPRPAAARHRA